MVDKDEKIWKKFLSNHWKMFALWIVGAILAFIGAIYVFLWHVEESQLVGLVPETLGLWSMGHFINFVLHLIFWELIFIGIPVIVVVAAIYFLWWKNLPKKERKEYKKEHLFGKRSRRTDASGGFSFIIFIGFIIKIYLDGNWDKPFAEWTFDYLVHSYLWVFIWIAVIVGIPMLIGGSWWIYYTMKK